MGSARHLLALAVLALLGAANMRGWLLHDVMPPANSDVPGYVAVAEAVAESLRDGTWWIRWSPRWFGGTSEFLSAFKEYLVAPAALLVGVPRALQLVVVAAKIAAAFGMYALVVRLAGAPAAGLLAAYAYAFGEIGNRLAWRLDAALTYAFFPAAALAATALLRRPRLGPALALGVIGAAQFLTNYLHVLLLAPLCLLFALLRPWEDRPGGRALLRGLPGPLVAGALLALALSASQLAWLVRDLGHHVFFAEESTREQMEYLSEFEPFLLVNRGDWLASWLWRHRPTDTGVYWERESRYLGFVVLGTIAAGWLAARRDRALRRLVQVGLLFSALCYWLALGPWTVLESLRRSFVWHGDTTALAGRLLATVGLAALAASAGGALLLRWRRRPLVPAPPLELLAGLGLCCLLLTTSPFMVLRDVVPPLALVRSPGKFFDLLPLGLALAFGAAVAGLGRRLGRGGLGAGGALVLGLLLVADYWPSTQRFFSGFPSRYVASEQRVLEDLPRDPDGRVRVLTLPDLAWPGIFDETTLDSLLIGRSALDGWNGWLPWQATRHWQTVGRRTMLTVRGCLAGQEVACGWPWPQLARVKYVLAGRLDYELSGWVRLRQTAVRTLWSRNAIMPPAYASPAWAVLVDTEDAVVADAVPEAVERGVVLLSSEGPEEALPEALVSGAVVAWQRVARGGAVGSRLRTRPPQPWLPVGYRRPARDEIVLAMDAGPRDAVVVVSEAYHPWWSATVDGAPVPLLRAFVGYQAVRVGPGRHDIVLRFTPPPLVRAADLVSTAAWVVVPLAGMAVALRRLRRRPAAADHSAG